MKAPTPSEAQQRQTRALIAKHGWAVITVPGAPGFVHTVGLTARRWPELMYTSDGPVGVTQVSNMGALLNRIVEGVIATGVVPHHGHRFTARSSSGDEHEVLLTMRFDLKPLTAATMAYKGVRALDVGLMRYTPADSVGEPTPDAGEVLAQVLAGETRTVVFRTEAAMLNWYDEFCERGRQGDCDITGVTNREHCFVIVFLTPLRPREDELTELMHAAVVEHHNKVHHGA